MLSASSSMKPVQIHVVAEMDCVRSVPWQSRRYAGAGRVLVACIELWPDGDRRFRLIHRPEIRIEPATQPTLKILLSTLLALSTLLVINRVSFHLIAPNRSQQNTRAESPCRLSSGCCSDVCCPLLSPNHRLYR